MKTKLLGARGTVGTSVISAILYYVFKWIAFMALYALCTLLIIPSLALYSTRLGDMLYEGYEMIKPTVWLAAVVISFLGSSFACAGFNYRFRKKIRKHFFADTFGMIGYKEGVRWFNENYGVLDRVLIAVLSVIINLMASIKLPVLMPIIIPAILADAVGGYVSLRRGLTFLRIHSITCD